MQYSVKLLGQLIVQAEKELQMYKWLGKILMGMGKIGTAQYFAKISYAKAVIEALTYLKSLLDYLTTFWNPKLLQ